MNQSPLARSCGGLLFLGLLLVAGCVYDAPLTDAPTRPIDERLVGDWTSTHGSDKLRVRKYDGQTFVLSHGSDLFRAWHSDLDGIPFMSVQVLDPKDHTWVYLRYEIDREGKKLTLSAIDEKLVPKKNVKTAKDAQALLRKNLKDPALFGAEGVEVYTRD